MLERLCHLYTYDHTVNYGIKKSVQNYLNTLILIPQDSLIYEEMVLGHMMGH